MTRELSRGLAAVASLVAITVGCAFERLSLALIVPGVIVLAMLIYSQVHGDDDS